MSWRARGAAAAAAFLLLTCSTYAGDKPSANDTAHFLAGLPVAGGSPLAAMQAQPIWKYHATYFNNAFAQVGRSHVARASKWAEANITVQRPTLFYFFSGPDFLYANAFFPYAKTYVMAGLEPPGTVPDLTKLPKGAMPRALRSLEVSLHAILGYSFFRTIDMRSDFRLNPLPGTIPVLYTFMVRSGKELHDASLVQLDEDGNVQTDLKTAKPGAKGVKITFATPGGPEQTLYYFSADVSGAGFAKSGLQKFCEGLGEGVGFVKSASYLLHGGNFAQIRTFLLQHSAAILEDDTGIPLGYFDTNWTVKPFGRYAGPISLFARFYQPRVALLFRKQHPGPLGFGIGYQYQPSASSLMYAVKKQPVAAEPPANEKSTGTVPAAPKPAVAPAEASPQTDQPSDATKVEKPAVAPATPSEASPKAAPPAEATKAEKPAEAAKPSEPAPSTTERPVEPPAPKPCDKEKAGAC